MAMRFVTSSKVRRAVVWKCEKDGGIEAADLDRFVWTLDTASHV